MTAWTGKLGALRAKVTKAEWREINRHLNGDTPAEWLSETLTKNGHPISASTIRTQRRTKGAR